MKEKSVKSDKPHCHVGTIGHVGHGKTTLTGAIVKIMNLLNKDKSKLEGKNSNVLVRESAKDNSSVDKVQYETEKVCYMHVDSLGDASYIKEMLAGTPQIDAAILVVSADDGPMVQTRQHILLARQVGINNIFLFINKTDLVDEQRLEECKNECMNLLLEYDYYTKHNLVIIEGSALKALECASTDSSDPEYTPIKQLLKELDKRCILNLNK